METNMDTKAQILAKAVLQFMQATYVPTEADAQIGKELEAMANEILKEPEICPEAPDDTPLNSAVLKSMGYEMKLCAKKHNLYEKNGCNNVMLLMLILCKSKQ